MDGAIYPILLFWLILSLVPAIIAANKGNSFGGMFAISLLVSPLIGLIIACVQPANQETVKALQVHEGSAKKCPYCAETIKAEAVVCRYCGRDLGTSKPVVSVILGDLSTWEPEFYFNNGTANQGPYSFPQIKQFIREKQIIGTTQVYHPRLEWQPAHSVQGLV